MKKHNEPYKRYDVYLPVRVWEMIAQYAVAHDRPLSQEVTRALEYYIDMLQESDTAIQAVLDHMQAKYGDKQEGKE